MRTHRGLFPALALTALLGFIPSEARAGNITMTITVAGFPLSIDYTSPYAQAGSTSNSLTINTEFLNNFLAANGSAYSFSTLGASSNFPGAPNPTGAVLSETGDAFLSGFVGINTITIDVAQSGFTAPMGNGSVRSTATALLTFTNAGDTQSSSTSYNGGQVATFLFTSDGSPLDNPSLPPFDAPVGVVNSGFSLGNSSTITLTGGEDQFTVSEVLGPSIASVPEPASIVMILSTMPLALVGALRLRPRVAAP